MADDMTARVIELMGIAFDIPTEGVTPETTLKSIGGTNSIKKLGLSSLLEDEYDIEISMPETSDTQVVGDFIKLVEDKVAAKDA